MVKKFFLLLFFTVLSQANADDKTLYIGDSHSVMSFGRTIVSALGPGTSRYAVAGSSAPFWLKKNICPAGEHCPFTYGYATPEGEHTGTVPADLPGIDELLIETKASTVVIALGTNDANLHCHSEGPEATQSISDLLGKLGGRRCFWIGPPKYTKGPVFNNCHESYNKYLAKMKNIIEGQHCKFIDSRKIIDPKTGLPIEANAKDKTHFDARLGKIWGRAATEEIIH